jgi:hypothetical protein
MKIADWLPSFISSGTFSHPFDDHEPPQNHSCCLAHNLPMPKKARFAPTKGAAANMATPVSITVASPQGAAMNPQTVVERIAFVILPSASWFGR